MVEVLPSRRRAALINLVWPRDGVEGGVDGRRPRRRYAIRPAPTDEELAKFGLAYDPRRPYHPVSNGAEIKCRLDGDASAASALVATYVIERCARC